MKNQDEITFAHDMLENTLRYFSDKIVEDDVLNITIMRDTLCWILEHDNDNFDRTIVEIRNEFYGEVN